jgi:ABC-type transport system involved in cytochrome c biogenesis ATPase subunit
LHLAALVLSVAASAAVTFAPDAILTSTGAEDAVLTAVVLYMAILALAPLLKLGSDVSAQAFSERFFNTKRIAAIEDYQPTRTETDLIFSQGAFVIKEAYKALYVEIPAALILIGMVIYYSTTKTVAYQGAVAFSIVWGLLSLAFSVWLGQRQNLNLIDADEPAMRMYGEFRKSYATYRHGRLRQYFIDRFSGAIAATSRIYVRFIFGAMAPGAASQFGLTICFLGAGFHYWLIDGDYRDLFPLYFQIGSISTTFIILAGQYPTIRSFLDFQRKTAKAARPIPTGYTFRSDGNGQVSVLWSGGSVELHHGRVYQLHGRNGVGKSLLLKGLAEHFYREQIEVAYLSGSVDIEAIEGPTHCSDGERQRRNLDRCLSFKPRVLLLDEATTGFDASAQAVLDALMVKLAAEDCLVIVVNHLLWHRRADHLLMTPAGLQPHIQGHDGQLPS